MVVPNEPLVNKVVMLVKLLIVEVLTVDESFTDKSLMRDSEVRVIIDDAVLEARK